MQRSSFDELAEMLAAELDGSLIDERLRLTPTERLEAMRRVLELIDSARPHADRPPRADRSPV